MTERGATVLKPPLSLETSNITVFPWVTLNMEIKLGQIQILCKHRKNETTKPPPAVWPQAKGETVCFSLPVGQHFHSEIREGPGSNPMAKEDRH